MPRIRSVKPQFWLDENLGKIPRDARLLYIGLWNLSDDQGVFEWRPARIKIQLFPYDDDISAADIEKWLGLLVGSKDIAKFEYSGHAFGYIKSFLEHQEIKKPSKWTFAPIPHQLLTVGEELPTSNPPVPVGSRGEGSRLKGVGSKETITTTESLSSLIKIWEQEKFGELTPLIESELQASLKEFGADKLKKALEIAVRAGKRNWSYVAGILLNWRSGRKKGEADPDKFVKQKYGDIVCRTAQDLEKRKQLRKERTEE